MNPLVKPSMSKVTKNAYAKKPPKKPVMHRVSYNAQYTCYACNNVGHLSFECPFKRNDTFNIKRI